MRTWTSRLVACAALAAGLAFAFVAGSAGDGMVSTDATTPTGTSTSTPTTPVDPPDTTTTEPPAALQIEGDDPVTVVFDRAARLGRIADLAVVIRTGKDEHGLLETRLTSMVTGNEAPMQVAAPTSLYPRRRPVLWSVGGPVRLAADTRTVVPLRLGLAWDAPMHSASVLLTFGIKGHGEVEPAALHLEGSLPALKAEPSTVKLRVTRYAGPLSGWLCASRCDSGDQTTLRLRGDAAATYPQAVPVARAPLHSDVQGTGEAELTTATASVSAPSVDATVAVKDLAHAGSYTGAIALDEAAGGDDQLVNVEAHVQDFILWPLGVLGLGALIGGYGVARYQQHRRREILRAELERVRRRLDAISTPEGLPAPPGDFEQLGKTIDDAEDEDAIAAATTAIATLSAAIDGWLDQRAAYMELQQARGDLPDGAGHDARTDALILETEAADQLSAEQRDDWIERATGQTRVLHALEDVWVAWLTDPEREDENPALAIYEAHRLPRTGDETNLLIQELRIALGRLTTATADEQLMMSADLQAFGGTALGAFRLSPDRWLRPRRRPGRRDPVEILAALRRWDRAIALAVFAVTAVAALIPLYVGNDFGSWDDYLTVFCAGFLGQAIGGLGAFTFNWKQLPGLRSYRPDPPAAQPAADA